MVANRWYTPLMLPIVGLYFAVLLAIGWWCHRTRISGMTDFLLAGRRLGVVLCAAAMAATHFGGGALMGGASYGFQHGVSGAWYGISTGIGLLLLALLTAGRFRALGLYTVPDVLAARYGGAAVRPLGALLSLVALVGILAAQVNAARGAFSIVGLEGPEAAVVATLVFIAYTAIGGLWAATISDVVQIAVAGVGITIAGFVVMSRASELGGLQAVLAHKGVGEEYFQLTGAGPSLILWLLLPTVMYTLIGQDFSQRLFAARDAAVARRAAFLGGLLLIAISFFPAVVGMGARGLSDLSDSTRSVPWVLQNLFDPLLGGVILAAIPGGHHVVRRFAAHRGDRPRGQGSVGRDPGAPKTRKPSVSAFRPSPTGPRDRPRRLGRPPGARRPRRLAGKPRQ